MVGVEIEQHKTCSKCGEIKPISKFNRQKKNKYGVTSYCKVCVAEYGRKRQKAISGAKAEEERERKKRYRHDNSEKVKEINRKWREANPERMMLRSAKRRAKTKGLPFDIRISDIFIPLTCPILEIPLFTSSDAAGPNSPSLDRIIPQKGYVKGNIRVISNFANTMRNNATWEQCEKLGQFATQQIERAKVALLSG